jgi:hypothetical protein
MLLVLALLIGALLFQPVGSSAFLPPPTGATPDPTLLPVATLLQSPLVVAYTLLNVPGLPAGGSYQDPTTNIKIYKLTSATFPTTGYSWTHSYSEGGDEVSLPHTGGTRTIHLYTGAGWHWLIDFTPGVGVSNPRMLDGVLKPWVETAFAFSNNPTTPYIAYVGTTGGIRKFDVRTMTEVLGGGWPLLSETNANWLHQSANDAFFVWMRSVRSTPVVGYEPATGTLKTFAGTGGQHDRTACGSRRTVRRHLSEFSERQRGYLLGLAGQQCGVGPSRRPSCPLCPHRQSEAAVAGRAVERGAVSPTFLPYLPRCPQLSRGPGHGPNGSG